MAVHHQLDELINRVLPVVQHFHGQAMFAPHAATINASGELAGRALTTDGTTQLSVPQAIEHFETTFRQLASAGEINASGIFYHSPGISTSSGSVSLPPATNTDECRSLVACLEHTAGDSVYLVIPYSGEPPSIEYDIGKLIAKPPAVFISAKSQQTKSWWRFW
jgi:hypothetical protein